MPAHHPSRSTAAPASCWWMRTASFWTRSAAPCGGTRNSSSLPDVIVIGWGEGSRAFVHATLAGRSAGLPDPLVVIVLRHGITSVPGLISLSLLPNVALLMQDQVDRLLRRNDFAKPGERAH